MNKKYLFGMLLSGAMLAACTADDLNTAPVAQEVNPSAPVFTVHFDGSDDLQNRATWDGSTNQWKVNFELGDLMSLYHGVVASNAVDAGDAYPKTAMTYTNGLKGYGNAIYEGKSGSEEGSFTFETRAMVNTGGAIMVYPADTTFAWSENTAGPVIKIDQKQDKETVLKTPYMSEVLYIAPYNGHIENPEAGYGRKYDVHLKRVGSTLDLTMDLKKVPTMPAGMKQGLELRRVVLRNDAWGQTHKKLFTTAVTVDVEASQSVAWQNDDKGQKHITWLNQSSLKLQDGTDNAVADSLITTDVTTDLEKAQATARFTLLPMVSTASTGTGTANEETTKAAVYVHTNFGYVKVMDTGSDPAKIWKKVLGTTHEKTLTDGFKSILDNDVLWNTATKGTYYKNSTTAEKVGSYVPRTLEVDMSGLNMDGLHIENEEHLMDALTLYNANFSDKKVQFVLDGEKEGENKGKFIMSEETWTALATALNKSNSKLTVAPCKDEDEVCETVVLKSGDNGATIPALQFQYATGADGTKATSYTLTMELEGDWAYVSSNESDKYLNLAGIAELNVVEGSTLTPKGYITAKGDFTITIEKGAEMYVKNTTDVVVVGKKLYNKGYVKIEAGNNFLRAGADGEIENCALEQDEEESVTGLTEGAGQIDNYGTLGIMDNTNGVVNNYGVIDIKHDNASTLVSNNAVASASIRKAFGTTVGNPTTPNKIGSIILPNNNGNGLTTVKGYKGFIKYEINTSDPSGEEVGTLANYIILGEGCDHITTNNVVRGTASKAGFPGSINYIESRSDNVKFDGEFTNVYALVIKKGTVQILNTCSLNIASTGRIYLAGYITNAGTLTYGGTALDDTKKEVYVGYFGGEESDYVRNTKAGNGK